MALLHEINNGSERFSVDEVGAVKINNAFTLPTVAGVNGYVLTSNGSGASAWQASTGGVGGAGTGQKVAKFAGTGTSSTIGDGPITFATNDSTFAGTIGSGAITSTGRVTGTQGLFGTTFALTSNGYATFGSTSSSVPIAIALDGNAASPALTIDTSNNATFAGDVTINSDNLTLTTAASLPIISVETTHTSGIPIVNMKGAASAQVRYQDENGNNQSRIDFNDAGAFNFIDATDGSSHLLINSSGNVIIGDTSGTSPNSADRFLKIGKSNLQDCSIILQDAVETWEIYQNDDLQFSFGTTPSTVMTMQRTTGNVGIKTTSPSSYYATDLVVSCPDEGGITIAGTAGDAQYLMFADGTSGPQRYEGYIEFNHGTNLMSYRSSGAMRFLANSSEKMRITSGGAINLGTGSLTQVSYQLRVDSDFDNGLYMSAGSSSSNYAMYIEKSTGGTSIFNIRGDGNVGIGVDAPAEKLSVVGGNIRLESTSAGNNGILMIYDSNTTQSGQIYGSSGDLRIYSPADVLFNQGGNVGIGTTNPSYELEVQGQGYFSSHLYAHCLGVGAATPNALGVIRAAGDIIAYYSSDKRLKDNIVKIEKPLEKLDKINGYEFDWNNKQELYEGHDIGVVAQEVEQVYPELVETRESGYKAVKYEKLVPLLVESIKELKTEIEQLKKQIK